MLQWVGRHSLPTAHASSCLRAHPNFQMTLYRSAQQTLPLFQSTFEPQDTAKQNRLSCSFAIHNSPESLVSHRENQKRRVLPSAYRKPF